MLVPADDPLELPEVPELPLLCPDEELDVEPLCPDDPEEEELGLCDEGELLGEPLGEGMLGDGMLVGELGGGELLLEEQPASASVSAVAVSSNEQTGFCFRPPCSVVVL